MENIANTEDFWELFYRSLFHPFQEFRRVAGYPAISNRLISYAILVVALISSLAPVLGFQGGSLFGLLLSVPTSIFLGLLTWLVSGMLIAGLGYAFTGRSRLKTFLVLSAFALLPWLLMAPLAQLKTAGAVGLALGTLCSAAVCLWNLLLYALAIAETFRLTLGRLLFLMFLPVVIFVTFTAWLILTMLSLFHTL